MTEQRIKKMHKAAFIGVYPALTEEEIKQGYHWCFSEWDGMFVCPDDPEYLYCTCTWDLPEGKPVPQ